MLGMMMLMKGVVEKVIEVMMINVRWRYSLRGAQVDCTRRGGVSVSSWRRNGEMMRMLLMVMRVVVMLRRVGCCGGGCCSQRWRVGSQCALGHVECRVT